MNKKTLLIMAMVALVCCVVLVLAACGENTTAPQGTPMPTETIDVTTPGTLSPVQEDPEMTQNNEIAAGYRISFYTGEGATEMEPILNVAAGSAISEPDEPKLARHTFEGWYTDYGIYSKQFTFDKMPAQNVCLYAKWTSNVSQNAMEDYEAQLAEQTKDKEGHLFIHYLRFNNVPEEYEPLNLWVWPYQQTGREFDWERDQNGNVLVDEIAGAVCDIDLTVKYTDAGKKKDQEMQFLVDAACGANYTNGDIAKVANYMNEQLGFLIVYKNSKDSGTHWRSDGNADQLFLIQEAMWDNNTLHVFCVQDNVSDRVFHLTQQKEIVNPYANDDGTHVSIGNVDSSATIPVQYGTATKLFDDVSGVGYQIMVASFADSNGDGIGDIQGIIKNFQYIKDLNVDVLWLTPIQLSDSYHGYDIIDYKEVDPKFGTLADYRQLLRLCHQNGMKVIMDLVLNHTSTNNVWFQRSAKMVVEDGIDYRNYYQWKNHTTTELSADWYPYSEYAYSYYGKFSPSMPELNYDYQGTRDAIVDVAKYWLNILGDGTGVDGFRIDAVKHIYMADEVVPEATDIIIEDYDAATKTDYSSNLTKNLNFFCEFVNRIKAEFPYAYLVGENFDGHAYNVAPYYEAYDGMLDFYMYYNFGELATYPTAAASLAGANQSSGGSVPTGRNTDRLMGGEWDYEGVLNTQMEYSRLSTGERAVMGSLFSSNHDIPRLVNNVIRKYEGKEWTAGTVTKENSAFAQQYAKAILATMATMPGISWIYYGDELGMSSNFDAGETATSPHVDRQYRQPFKWTTSADGSEYITHYSISGDVTFYVKWDAYNTTLAGVDVQEADPNSFLNEVRYWTKLKSEDKVLRYGSYAYKPINWGGGESSLFSFTRSYDGVTYWVITNFSPYEYDVSSLFGSNPIVAVTAGSTAAKLAAGATIVCRVQ